jgi:hypothetical protein
VGGPARISFCHANLPYGYLMQFRFSVRKGRTTEQVVGTYKVVKQTGAPGGLMGLYSPLTGEIVKSKPPPQGTTWKMIVDTAKREPIR